MGGATLCARPAAFRVIRIFRGSSAIPAPVGSRGGAVFTLCTSLVGALYRPCTRSVLALYTPCSPDVRALYWPCTSRQPSFPTGPFRHSAFLLQPFPHFGVASPGLKAPARGWTGNGSANGPAAFQRTATMPAFLRDEAPHIIQPGATSREPRPTSPQRAESPA